MNAKNVMAHKMRAAGASYKDIGIALGVSPSRARQRCKRFEYTLKMAQQASLIDLKTVDSATIVHWSIISPLLLSVRARNCLLNGWGGKTLGQLRADISEAVALRSMGKRYGVPVQILPKTDAINSVPSLGLKSFLEIANLLGLQ